MNPEILENVEAGVDDSYDFMEHSAFLPSDETESSRDGSESVVSFDDSAAGDATRVTALDDDLAYDSDGSSYIVYPQAALEPTQAVAQTDDSSSLEALGETQMFNSTLTSRTITQSQIDVKSPNSYAGELETPSTLARRLKPGKLYELKPTKLFRILYHGPSEHKDDIVEKIAQAIATSSISDSPAVDSTEGGSRFNIVPISFEDPHVTLIPSTGLELIVTEAGKCFEDCDELTNALEGGCWKSHWCKEPKQDLAIFLHGTSRSPPFNSFLCSTSVSQLGTGTLDLSIVSEEFPSGLAFRKLKAVERVAAGSAHPHIEEFETMSLDEFLDLDATSLSNEIAWATGLANNGKSEKFVWEMPSSAKTQLHSIINRINDGYSSVISTAKNSYLSLDSVVRHTYKQMLATTHAKVEQVKSLPFSKSFGQNMKTAVSVVSIPTLILLCYLLTYQLWMPWVLDMSHRMSTQGHVELIVPSASPTPSVWVTATGKEPRSMLLPDKVYQVVTSVVSAAAVRSAAPLQPQKSSHKTYTKEAFALQVFSDDGKRFLRLSPSSLARGKAPEVFLNATSGAKPVNATITKINSTLYEFKVDMRNVKGSVDIFAWTKGSAPLSLNFTIIDNDRPLLQRFKHLVWRPMSHWKIKMPGVPHLPVLDAGKILNGSSKPGLLTKKVTGFGNFTSTSYNRVSLRLRNGRSVLQDAVVNPLSNRTMLALAASMETIGQASNNLGQNLKQSFTTVTSKIISSSPSKFGSATLLKARTRALTLSKKIAPAKLGKGIQENPVRLIDTAKQVPGYWTACSQDITRKFNYYIAKTSRIFPSKHKTPTLGKTGVSATAKVNRKRGGKHREPGSKKSDGPMGMKRLTSRLAQLVPHW